MNERQRELAARRALLLMRSAEQREVLSEEFGAWSVRALTVDRWIQAVYRYRFVVAIGAGVAAWFVLRRGRGFTRRRLTRSGLVRWGRRAWFGWGLWRSLRAARARSEESPAS